MNNENKKGHKFNFISSEDQLLNKEEKTEIIESFIKDEPKEKQVEETAIEVVKAKVEEPINKESFKKPYFGFETRVLLYVILILIVFSGTCYFGLKAINFGKKKEITYNEISTINYNICTSNGNCSANNKIIKTENLNTIKAFINYEKDFSEAVDYNYEYKVVAMTKVYDPVKVNKVVYTVNDELIENKSLKGNDNKINIMANVDLYYEKYKNIANNFRSQFAPNAKSEVVVNLYLEKNNESESVAALTFPLNEKEFTITKSLTLKNNGTYSLPISTWDDNNYLYAILAIILGIILLFLLYKLIRLILLLVTNRNKYQEYLNEILREYDRIIVVARDGYESNVQKDEIKVETFDDLLDTRDILEKPIIYSKVNDVKSDFIVEDDNKIYKYTLKEASFPESRCKDV